MMRFPVSRRSGLKPRHCGTRGNPVHRTPGEAE